MTDTTVSTYTLTRQDVRALRHADGVSFHLYEGRCFIRAEKRGDGTTSGFSQAHVVATGFRVADYQHDGSDRGPNTEYEGFAYVQTAQFNRRWLTVAGRITVGCTLSLLWVRANNNQNVTRAGLWADELDLVITRNDKDETYWVSGSVGPDNSARMVRRAH